MKKSLIDISWQVDEPTYRADSAYSYSTLSRFSREGFRKLDKLQDKISSASLLFGSLVDTLLTGTEKEFKENYFVAVFPNITESLETITRELYNIHKKEFTNLKDIPPESIHQVARNNNYWANDKYANTRLKNILEGCPEFYKLLVLAGDKTVISRDLLDSAIVCVEELKTNDFTKQYFNKPSDWEDIEVLYQLKFKGTYEDFTVRCMLDCVLVDHKNKKLILVDLKTSSSYEEDFMKSFVKWGYYIQAQLYAYIVKQNILLDDYFKDFTIEDYKFVVVNKLTITPLVWEFPYTFCEVSLKDIDTGLVYTNWRKVLKDLDYYLKYTPKYPLGIEPINKITNLIKAND